jgi:NAD(P)H dehydrogenase (quinone)
VRELASAETIAAKPAWQEHLEATRDVPEATPEDMEWADGYVFGTPTRFGLPAAQLKQFIDTTGPLWAGGKLHDKAAAAFTGAGNPHGGQEPRCWRCTTCSITGVPSSCRWASPTLGEGSPAATRTA